MKSTDLMIGDWVNIYTFPNDNPLEKDLFPAKVVSILDGLPTEQLHTIECIFPNKDGGYGIASRPVETCLPIPLTPEILEKNGWKSTKSPERFDMMVLSNNIQAVLWWFTQTSTLMLIGGSVLKVSYVHQLQHALKLYGIEKEIIL